MGRTIYVVTHPEATHHVEGVVGGWHDSDLTVRGQEDAEAIARSLGARMPIGASVELFSSDSLRARRTADPIGETLGTAVTLDARLREKSYGIAEGRPQGWLNERFVPPPATGDRLAHDEGIREAETKGAFAERIFEAMDAITASAAEHQVVVTHGFALTFVIAAWIRMPQSSLGFVSFRSTPGSITTLRQDDRFHNREVTALADTRHLRPAVGRPDTDTRGVAELDDDA